MMAHGQPQDLALERLGLRFEGNVYFAASGQGWFHWGPSWTRHKFYTTLSEFQSDLRIDTKSQTLDPRFADILQRDFRLRPQTMAVLQDSYPRGLVPGVTLGVIQ